jgi:YggT family protein
MNDYLRNPIEFLLSVLFGLYILAVLLRFLLQWVRADFYNPLSQAIVKLTNPALRPLRRIIPGLGGIDVAALLLVLALQMILGVLLTLLRGAPLQPGWLLLWSVGELVALTFNIFIFSLIIQALLSWVNPGHYNPVSGMLSRLNEPLLRPARRLIPPFSGLDLSPLVVILLLQVAKMLVMPLFGMFSR